MRALLAYFAAIIASYAVVHVLCKAMILLVARAKYVQCTRLFYGFKLRLQSIAQGNNILTRHKKSITANSTSQNSTPIFYLHIIHIFTSEP
jgi:hypothetical protein